MGKTERGVNPGIVFNSLMINSLFGVKKKSTLAKPSHPSAKNAVTAASLIESLNSVLIFAGISKLVEPSQYLASKS